jgi:hypothetical protein
MRPLAAHVQLRLSSLYQGMRRCDEARTELATAVEMYPGMETPF